MPAFTNKVPKAVGVSPHWSAISESNPMSSSASRRCNCFVCIKTISIRVLIR